MDLAQERLQDIDRELDALGAVPEQLPELVARYRDCGTGIEEADEALWELQQGFDIPQRSGARAPRPKAADAPVKEKVESAESPAGEAGKAQQEPALDEVDLFANIEAYDEDEAQEEPSLERSVQPPSQEIDSDFKQVLQLDIDPSVFPPSIPPQKRAELEARSDKEDATADQGDEAAAAVSKSGEAQSDVDELDEDFLALLDEDVIELEDE